MLVGMQASTVAAMGTAGRQMVEERAMFVEEAPISAIESSWPEVVAVCLATRIQEMAAMVGAALAAQTIVVAKVEEGMEAHRPMVVPPVGVVLLLAMAAAAAAAA